MLIREPVAAKLLRTHADITFMTLTPRMSEKTHPMVIFTITICVQYDSRAVGG